MNLLVIPAHSGWRVLEQVRKTETELDFISAEIVGWVVREDGPPRPIVPNLDLGHGKLFPVVPVAMLSPDLDLINAGDEWPDYNIRIYGATRDSRLLHEIVRRRI